MKKFLALLTGVAVAAISLPATAQGIGVIDPSNIAQTAKVVKNGVDQVQQLKAQVKQITDMKNTIGAMGAGQIGSILDNAGLNLKSGDNDLMSQFRQTIPGILDGLPSSEIGKNLGIDAGAARNARTSIDAGRRFALNTFFVSPNASIDEVTARQGIREAAMRDSATAGFATAVVTKTRLSESEATINALNEQMAASTDLRTDVQSNSAVGMAMLQQIVVQNQLIAQLLEVQATGNMATNVNATN